MVLRIEITDFENGFVSVDFEEEESGILVNFNLSWKDLVRLQEIINEATSYLNEQLEKLVKQYTKTEEP